MKRIKLIILSLVSGILLSSVTACSQENVAESTQEPTQNSVVISETILDPM